MTLAQLSRCRLWFIRAIGSAALLIAVALTSPLSSAANGVPLQVTAVDVVGLTVSDMNRA
jgi:hypothetical protein